MCREPVRRWSQVAGKRRLGGGDVLEAEVRITRLTAAKRSLIESCRLVLSVAKPNIRANHHGSMLGFASSPQATG